MPSDDEPSSSHKSSATTASLLGAAALVGAAAGYAMLAFRFRHFGSTANTSGRFSSGSAEMRAGGAFSKEWVKQAEQEGASAGGQGASAGGRQGASAGRQDASAGGSSHQRASDGSTGDGRQHQQHGEMQKSRMEGRETRRAGHGPQQANATRRLGRRGAAPPDARSPRRGITSLRYLQSAVGYSLVV